MIAGGCGKILYTLKGTVELLHSAQVCFNFQQSAVSVTIVTHIPWPLMLWFVCFDEEELCWLTGNRYNLIFMFF